MVYVLDECLNFFSQIYFQLFEFISQIYFQLFEFISQIHQDDKLGLNINYSELDQLIGKTSQQIEKLQELVSDGDHKAMADSASLLESVKSTGSTLSIINSASAKTSSGTQIAKDGPKEMSKNLEEEGDNSSESAASFGSSSSVSSYRSCSADEKDSNNADTTSIEKPAKEEDSSESSGSEKDHPNVAGSNADSNADSEVSASYASAWQQLLSLPSQQFVVMERMYSGSKRFVVLDFGSPVFLTDIVIPMCQDVLSLIVDVWLTGEDTDAQRIVVCGDLNTKPLVVSDLQPPPLCRYLKMSSVGKYGVISAEGCFSIGSFYGHKLLMTWAPYSSYSAPNKNLTKHQSQVGDPFDFFRYYTGTLLILYP